MRDAFRALGHNALSVDLKPTSSPGPHHQGSVWDVIDDGWDLMVGFPPCTYLCKAQMYRYGMEPCRPALRDQAVLFFNELYHCRIRHVALENPPGYLNKNWGQPTQLIRPYNFGDPYDKEICLWLKGLPPIISTIHNPVRRSITNHVNGRMTQIQKSHIKSSWSRFPGMSAALANQWSSYVLPLVHPTAPLLTGISASIFRTERNGR